MYYKKSYVLFQLKNTKDITIYKMEIPKHDNTPMNKVFIDSVKVFKPYYEPEFIEKCDPHFIEMQFVRLLRENPKFYNTLEQEFRQRKMRMKNFNEMVDILNKLPQIFLL